MPPNDQPRRAHHRWGVLTDLHLADPTTADSHWHNRIPLGRCRDVFTSALARLDAAQPDRLILLGDQSESASEADYQFLRHQLAHRATPTWMVPGNHDLPNANPGAWHAVLEQNQSEDAMVPRVPQRLDGAVVIAGGLHPDPDSRGAYTVKLELPEPTSGDLLVVLTHFPVLDLEPVLRQARLEDAGNLRNRSAVAAKLTDWPGPVLVLHGHQHIRTHVTTANILQLGFGALAEQPHDAAVLDIEIDSPVASETAVDVARTSRAVADPAAGARPTLLDPDHATHRWRRGRWAHAGAGTTTRTQPL